MAAFDFILPISKKDLLKRTTTRQYVVEEIIGSRHLPGALEEFRVAMKNCGYLTILQKFDVPFSILCSEAESSHSLKETLWQILVKGLSRFSNALQHLLQENTISSENQSQHLNALKMLCYLVCQLADGFEAEETKVGIAQGRKKKISETLTTLDWAQERDYCLKVILQIVELDINRLWDPPVAEEEFISLITGFCYKLLENPNVSRQKDTKDVIGNILGILVKRHNRALSASLRIIQLLQHFEHTVLPLTGIVEVMVTKYGVNNVVFEIMREIGRLDSKDLSNDSSGTRSYTLFLVELAAKLPTVMLQNISFLMPALETDCYVMRNCLLSIMKEIVIQVLSQEDLEPTLKNTRDQFFEIMKECIHDVHAFVRSKVLQNWQQIVRGGCLPLSYQEDLVSLVLGRLDDKSANVRRYAIQLFTALLQSNPYASNLQFQELKANYNKENDKLEAMLQEQTKSDDSQFGQLEKDWTEHENHLKESLKELPWVDSKEVEGLISEEDNPESILKLMVELIESKEYLKCYHYLSASRLVWPDNVLFSFTDASTSNCSEEEDSTEDVTEVIKQFKTIFIETKKVDLQIVCPVAQTETEQTFELKKQQVLVMYLKDSLTFSSQLKQAIPLMCKMLRSKLNSDVLEAIEFFVIMFEFGLSDALKGIRQILLLLYSAKDAAIKEAAVTAYKRIYLDPKGGNQRSKALKIITNLTALIHNASLEEFISMDRMMCQLMSSGEVHSSVIQMLWERFTMKVPNTTPEESRYALILLTMAAGADTEIIKSNISVLIAEGLGPRSENDFKLARDTCLALLKIGINKKKIGDVAPRPYRLEQDHDLFARLQELLLKGFPDLENKFWIPFCEKAINVIYTLSESPDHTCAALAKEVAKMLSKIPTGESELGDCGGLLTRFVSLIGNIAHRQFEYLEKDILSELKRRAAVIEKGKTKNKKGGDRTLNSTAATIEEELGLVGASAEDDEAEHIRKVCEKEVLVGDTFLALVAPLIVDVCRKQSKYSDPDLRTAACLALSKLMLLSSEFCDDNLQLLFTILEKSSLPKIRSNTIIALGDLAFLYPNQIEPWTAHMYSRLRDPSSLVRRSTVSVLSHLILNDMVKVKGQISEMATCIIDEDEKIQGLAKVFFMELSKKGNAVYNVMADIISRLSDSEIGVEETQFQTILKYLFTFIQKDKQSESLVEKLCQRFRVTKTERQWRDLAFCLSLLSFNEKAVRKLQENFTCYGDKLADDNLYHYFTSILKKSRTKCKAEFKTTIDELEAQIVECHNKGLTGEEVVTQVAHVFKTPAKTPARTRRTASKTVSQTPDKPKKALPKKTPQRKKTNKTDYFSSESDSENEPPTYDSSSDSDVATKKMPAYKIRATRKRRHTPLQVLNTP